MNILLTNDDGYYATGIKLLKEKLSKYGKVVVVAPNSAMSAKSCSIVFMRPVSVKQIEPDVYAMDGTPADCVAFGISSLNIKFDLVVSGCNEGANISYDIIYSGTVGACLQALTYNLPTIAVSCELNFNIVDKYFDEMFDYITQNNLLSSEYLLNVNFPYGDVVKGIKITDLYYRKTSTYYIKKDENMYLAWRDVDKNEVMPKSSDCYAVNNQIISITPLNKTYFSKDLFEQVSKKIK